MEPLMRLITLILPLALLGCTQFPELDNAVSASGHNAEYPTLVPVQSLFVQSRTTGPTAEQTVAGLNARVLALQNRAARLRGSVVDANTRNRIRNGVN
jgi:hypothetical protein|tara:strand:- start:3691 stop:3984 length:294 start_codon:yes stop_codon:yes gene_type:complete